MNNSSANHTFQELDLAISNLDTPGDELKAGEILAKLPGVEAVRIIERGIWLSFDSEKIHHDAIITALHNAGYKASLFQDSETGEIGTTEL